MILGGPLKLFAESWCLSFRGSTAAEVEPHTVVTPMTMQLWAALGSFWFSSELVTVLGVTSKCSLEGNVD